MPANLDMPRVQNHWTEQETGIYEQYPYFLQLLAARRMPMWSQWDKFFGSRPWVENHGTTMKIVEPTYSPVSRQMFFPNPMTQMPNRDVHETRERVDTAIIYRHNFETPYLNWRGPFEDFHKRQIPHAIDNLTRQIGLSNDQFIRTYVFHYAPHVIIAGKETTGTADGFDGRDFVAAPSGVGAADGSAVKSTAWLQQAVAYVGTASLSNLSYKLVKRAITIFREDIQAPFYEGMYNMPKENELVKGKYVLKGSLEALEYLEFDEHVMSFQKNNVTIEDSEFSGKIGSHCLYHCERFPLRMTSTGEFPAPEIEVQGDVFNAGETVPNPAYLAADYEWAFLIGGYAFESISIGPPAAEFAGQGMSDAKFAKLQWNGVVRLTDYFLLNIGTVDAPKYTTNKYGEFVQAIADTVHGIMPLNRRYVLPILYKRARVSA